jgi:hypothetical protein
MPSDTFSVLPQRSLRLRDERWRNIGSDICEKHCGYLHRDEYDVLHKDLTIKATFVVNANPRVVELPYRLLYFSRVKQEWQRVALQPRFDRSGVLALGGNEYNVIMHTSNHRGLYSNPIDCVFILTG